MGNPIPGTFGPSPLDATISYETQATDTGQDVSCTVTAANGVNTSSSTQTYRVTRVAPDRMDPSRVLEALELEKYSPRDSTTVPSAGRNAAAGCAPAPPSPKGP